MDNPRLAYLRDKVKKLPLQPGIYIMKDKKGQIISARPKRSKTG